MQVEKAVQKQASEAKNTAKRFKKQYDRSYMAPKHRMTLSKSLEQLKEAKPNELSRQALSRRANTFTPYKLHLLNLAEKKVDVAKIGNITRSNVLRRKLSRQSSAPAIQPCFDSSIQTIDKI